MGGSALTGGMETIPQAPSATRPARISLLIESLLSDPGKADMASQNP
jgi:hypothetical protein